MSTSDNFLYFFRDGNTLKWFRFLTIVLSEEWGSDRVFVTVPASWQKYYIADGSTWPLPSKVFFSTRDSVLVQVVFNGDVLISHYFDCVLKTESEVFGKPK